MIDKKDGIWSDVHNEQLLFKESFLKSKATKVHDFESGSKLYLQIKDLDGEPFEIYYALMDFNYSEMVGTEEIVYYAHVFSGLGTAGLREMRHTYFGDSFDGYCFYLPGKDVIKALEILQEYFDMD